MGGGNNQLGGVANPPKKEESFPLFNPLIEKKSLFIRAVVFRAFKRVFNFDNRWTPLPPNEAKVI